VPHSVDRVGVDDDFDAAILGFTGGSGVGSERVVLAHREHGKLARWEAAALDELLEDGLRLSVSQGVGRGGIRAERIVGVRFDDDALTRVRALYGGGDFVQDAEAVRLELSGAGGEELVGGDLDANDFAILADVEAGDRNGGERLANAVVGGDRRAAAGPRGCLNRVNLLVDLLLGNLRFLETVRHVAELPLEQGDLLLRGLAGLLGLCELAVQVGVVDVELANAAVQILNL